MTKRKSSVVIGQNSPNLGSKTKSKVGIKNSGQKIKLYKSLARTNDKNNKNESNDDKNLSDRKIKTIKSYFESLSKSDATHDRVLHVTGEEEVAGDEAIVDIVSKKEIVKEKIDAFELLMLGRGDTQSKTPQKLKRNVGRMKLKK